MSNLLLYGGAAALVGLGLYKYEHSKGQSLGLNLGALASSAVSSVTGSTQNIAPVNPGAPANGMPGGAPILVNSQTSGQQAVISQVASQLGVPECLVIYYVNANFLPGQDLSSLLPANAPNIIPWGMHATNPTLYQNGRWVFPQGTSTGKVPCQ